MRKSQSGRSMVEMLGVLAIIGVLSIGGIAGYTLSMRRFRVNNALDIVNKYALTVYSACQSKMLLTNTATLENCTAVAFSESGLGGYPSGVKLISAPKIVGTTTANTTAANRNVNSDRIDIIVKFDGEELCKTAASITGGVVAGGTDMDTPPVLTAAQKATAAANVCYKESFLFTLYMN